MHFGESGNSKPLIGYGECKYSPSSIWNSIISLWQAVLLSERWGGATAKCYPRVSEKSCSDPVCPTASQAATNSNFRVPAAASGRSKVQKDCSKPHVNFLIDYLMTPWLQTGDWESLDWKFSSTTDLLHSLGLLTCSQFPFNGVPYLQLLLRLKWLNYLKLWLILTNLLRSTRYEMVRLLSLLGKYIGNTFHKSIPSAYVIRANCYYSVLIFFLIRQDTVCL